MLVTDGKFPPFLKTSVRGTYSTKYKHTELLILLKDQFYGEKYPSELFFRLF